MYILSVIILVIGFVLLVKGADFFRGWQWFSGKKVSCSGVYHRHDYRCHGNQRTGMRRQHFRIVERQQWNGHQ